MPQYKANRAFTDKAQATAFANTFDGQEETGLLFQVLSENAIFEWEKGTSYDEDGTIVFDGGTHGQFVRKSGTIFSSAPPSSSFNPPHPGFIWIEDNGSMALFGSNYSGMSGAVYHVATSSGWKISYVSPTVRSGLPNQPPIFPGQFYFNTDDGQAYIGYVDGFNRWWIPLDATGSTIQI